jgi:hypothetical protein
MCALTVKVLSAYEEFSRAEKMTLRTLLSSSTSLEDFTEFLNDAP